MFYVNYGMAIIEHPESIMKVLKRMEKYASANSGCQKDMGIKTTSFPHLGVYGDAFILNNKNNERVKFEDHSALKKKQDAYEKWQAQNSKEHSRYTYKKPIWKKAKKIETFPDDVVSTQDYRA